MVFHGIMPDTSVAKVLTTRKSQFQALQCEIPEIELNITHANKATIYFKNRLFLNLIDIFQVLTLIGTANFYVVNIPISFFLCLKDMDIFGIYLNNITN